MKVVIVLFAVIVISFALPADKDQIHIISSDFETKPDGGYSFSYESEDGSAREEKAVILNAGQENEMISIVGKYRYKNDKGELVEVSYTSDDRGFIPTGTIIHKAVVENALLVSKIAREESQHHHHIDEKPLRI